MDLDIILKELGEYGPYQRNLIFFVLLPCALPCAFHAYIQLFMAAAPPYSCFTKSYTDITNGSDNSYQSSSSNICCSNGYNFSHVKYETTVVTEWNLVCEKSFYPTLALVLFGVGGFIGNFIFGYLQDRLGRRPSFFIYLLIECIFGIGTAFAWDYWSWVFFRFGVGFTVPAIYSTPYVLPIELVGPKYRTRCTIFSNIAYSLGLVMLAVVVYMIRNWRHLSLVTSIPLLFYFIFWWFIPESPRWLLVTGQFNKAKVIMFKMAKANKKPLPIDYMDKLQVQYEKEWAMEKQKANTYGIKHLFRSSNLRKTTTIITFIWFTNTSVYVGLSYYAPALSGNEFFNFFLAGLAELPTYIILWPAMEYYGRREILCISMLIGGISCLATVFSQNGMITLLLYCIGKMGISSSYVVLPLFASELYPTVVRGLGMSFSSVAGMLGPIFIPIVNYMGINSIVPLVVMGTLLLAGGFASLILPETKDLNLPQTMVDIEQKKRREI